MMLGRGLRDTGKFSDAVSVSLFLCLCLSLSLLFRTKALGSVGKVNLVVWLIIKTAVHTSSYYYCHQSQWCKVSSHPLLIPLSEIKSLCLAAIRSLFTVILFSLSAPISRGANSGKARSGWGSAGRSPHSCSAAMDSSRSSNRRSRISTNTSMWLWISVRRCWIAR